MRAELKKLRLETSSPTVAETAGDHITRTALQLGGSPSSGTAARLVVEPAAPQAGRTREFSPMVDVMPN